MENIQTTAKAIDSNKKVKWCILGGFLILCIILSCITYNAGVNSKLKTEVINQTLAKDKEYTQISDKLKKIQSEINSQQELLTEINDYKTNKEQKTAEIAQLDNDISTKSENLSSINNDIAAKSAELDNLKNVIKATGEAPKVLGAGEYTVGSDIQPGRYSVTGQRNFIVHSVKGDLKVNTIFDSRYGVDSYICNLEIGDTLKLSGKDTFTPIQ